MQRREFISDIEKETLKKADYIYESGLDWESYVKSPTWRSPTLANMQVSQPEKFRTAALKKNIITGRGYGPLLNSCIRIANFPVITIEDLKLLSKIALSN